MKKEFQCRYCDGRDYVSKNEVQPFANGEKLVKNYKFCNNSECSGFMSYKELDIAQG